MLVRYELLIMPLLLHAWHNTHLTIEDMRGERASPHTGSCEAAGIELAIAVQHLLQNFVLQQKQEQSETTAGAGMRPWMQVHTWVWRLVKARGHHSQPKSKLHPRLKG